MDKIKSSPQIPLPAEEMRIELHDDTQGMAVLAVLERIANGLNASSESKTK